MVHYYSFSYGKHQPTFHQKGWQPLAPRDPGTRGTFQEMELQDEEAGCEPEATRCAVCPEWIAGDSEKPWKKPWGTAGKCGNIVENVEKCGKNVEKCGEMQTKCGKCREMWKKCGNMWRNVEKMWKNVEKCGKNVEKCGEMWKTVETCGKYWDVINTGETSQNGSENACQYWTCAQLI